MNTTTAEFTIQRRELAAALQRLNATAPRRSPRPILQCVRISVNGSVYMAATDMETFLAEHLAATIESKTSGADSVEALASGSELAAMLKHCKADSVSIHVEADENGGTVRIVDSSGAFQLTRQQSVIESPTSMAAGTAAPESGGTRTRRAFCFITAAEFRRLFLQTDNARDSESSRFALGAFLLELPFDGGSFCRLVATDGRRLHVSETGSEPADIVAELVPAAALKTVAAAAKSADWVVFELFRDTWENGNPRDRLRIILASAAGRVQSEFWTMLVEGRFPKWRDCFTVPEPVATIDAAALLAVLKPAATYCNEESRGVDVYKRSNAAGGRLIVAKNNGRGNTRFSRSIPLAADSATARRFFGRFDVAYLTAIAAAALAGSKTALLRLSGKDSQSSAQFSADGFRAIVMPLRCSRGDRQAERNTQRERAAAVAAEQLAADSAPVPE